VKILHLEDNPLDAELAREFLRREWPDCEIAVVDARPTFLAALQDQEHDIILSDFSLVSFSGLEGFKLARERTPDTPFIFFSGTIPEDVAITAVRDGAADYVLKERPKRLITAIRHALQKRDEIRRRQAAEERFRQLVEQASDAILVYDAEGRFRDVNRRACESLGYTADELQQLRMADIDGDFDSPAAAEGRARVLRGETATFSGRHRRKDGSLFPVEVRLSRFDLAGEHLFLALARDITERVEAERKIREQGHLLNRAREAIILTDLENRVIYWNRGAERLLGWTEAEVIGQPLDQFMSTPRLEAAPEAGPGDEWRGELPVRDQRGRALTLDVHLTVIRDEAGRPSARLGISTDVTERNQLKEQFFRAQRLESVGMLAAGIAHDLNNVMAPMLMAPTMLRARVTDARDVRMLDILERSAERGTGLVRQILGFAHGTGGEHRPLQVKHLLRDLSAMIEQTFPKSITLEEAVPSDLWPILGSATQIHQVLLNLCINARDAMPRGGTLRLQAENVTLDEAAARALEGGRPGAWLVLHIEDTGSGIPSDVVARIWDPFFTTKEPGKGTGLGLSTVRGIVEHHSGFVTLQTKEGRGTTFRVYLPAADQPTSRNSADPYVAAPRGNGETVLIVDDEANIRDVTVAVLTAHGYRAQAAPDGTEALGLFAPKAADVRLVITDLNMPGFPADTLASILRRLNPEVKIMAMSGLSAEAKAEKLKPAFADAFLSKPFKADALLAAVHGALHPGAA